MYVEGKVAETASKTNYSGENHVVAVPDAPPVQQAFTRLDSRIGDLHDMITGLERRLDGVLSPEPPENGGAQAQESRSALHQAVLNATSRVASADERIGRLIDRLTI